MRNWHITTDLTQYLFHNWRMTLPPEILARMEHTVWEPCQAGFELELERELRMNRKHPLYGVKAKSIARHRGTDDVLFLLEGHQYPLASVHLTYNVEWRREWPSVDFYSNWDEWIAAVEREEEEIRND